MTEAIVELVKTPEPIPIKDADQIEAMEIGGYTVVTRKGNFKPGDLGLFISVDSVVPMDILKHYELDTVIKNGRVRTKRLKGIWSQGLLLPLTYPSIAAIKNPQEGLKLGQSLGITKWTAPIRGSAAQGSLGTRQWVTDDYHVYDIESIQNPHNTNIFGEGDHIAVTEKIHGMHSSCGWLGDQFFYTSRKYALRESEDENQDNTYYRIIRNNNLKEKTLELKKALGVDNIALRYEIYGFGVQPLRYGLKQHFNSGIDYAVFDIEAGFNKYLPHDNLLACCREFKLKTAPELYVGPFNQELIEKLAEKNSVIAANNGVEQLSEGIVIKDFYEGKPTSNNRYLQARRILKLVSKRYSGSDKADEEVADE